MLNSAMAFIRVNDLSLRFTVAGTGPAIVLVHSWGTSARVWDTVLTDLARDFRVLAYDWRGCGHSDHPAEGNTIDQNADDLLALCAALQLDRPVLVGSSVGGLFAMQAARRSPDAVRGVVVVDGPGHWASLHGDVLRAHVARLASDRAATVTQSVTGMYTAAASEALRGWTIRQLLDSGPFIDRLFLEQADYDPRPWLPHLRVPIRYIHGRHDTAVPVRVAEELAELSPFGHDLVIMEDSGHLPHQEQPGAVADAIRTFSMAELRAFIG